MLYQNIICIIYIVICIKIYNIRMYNIRTAYISISLTIAIFSILTFTATVLKNNFDLHSETQAYITTSFETLVI